MSEDNLYKIPLLRKQIGTICDALYEYDAPLMFGVIDDNIRARVAEEVYERIDRKLSRNSMKACLITMNDREYRVTIAALEQHNSKNTERLLKHIEYYREPGDGEQWIPVA